MIKAIASDLDGTLLLHGAQALNPEIYDIILELKKKGIAFISASGRQLASQHNLFAPIVDEISYIAENGAVCLHEGETIVASGIDRELGLRIANEVSKRPGCKVVISGIEACYMLSGDDAFFYHVSQEMNNVTVAVDAFEDIQEPFLKICYYDEGDILASAGYFQELFEKDMKVITSGNVWVDFLPYDCNKAVALKILLDKMNILPEEVISFGDQQNDVEMLTMTGKSYAMSGAVPEAKACADEITDSVEKTLLELLKKLGN